MEHSKINWTTHTFNAWEGCTRVSQGCVHCYAERRDNQYHNGSHWGPGAPRKGMSEGYWWQPIKWNREAAISSTRPRVFCGSLCDVFDSEAPIGQRERLWEIIRKTSNLDWLLLTKRPGNIEGMLPADWGSGYANVWLGVTVEDAKSKTRIEQLRQVAAEVRFLSIEPLIEDLGDLDLQGIDWAIVGGESGPGARAFEVNWAASIVAQCYEQGVSPWVKQLGAKPVDLEGSLKLTGAGHDWEEWPERLAGLKVRELPVNGRIAA